MPLSLFLSLSSLQNFVLLAFVTHPQVTHVVLFDFPNSTADYLHRLGRTGRVGSKGSCRVTALMSHRRDIRTAYEIKVCI